MLILASLIGCYLLLAWASYSPLDNAWTVANSVLETTLNKAGPVGAWVMDILYAMFGKTAFIVPFSLTFVPIYLLFLGTDLYWEATRVARRIVSFLILMVGLAMLANALLSAPREYLAGGFIGYLLSNWFAQYLGFFGALLVAMVFTVVGIYFCSAHTLVELGSRLYYWVFAEQRHITSHHTEAVSNAPTNTPDEEVQAVKNQESFASTVTAPTVEMNEENGFVDITSVSRPNIFGLKTPNEEAKEAEISIRLPTSTPSAPPMPSVATTPAANTPSAPHQVELTNVAQFSPRMPAQLNGAPLNSASEPESAVLRVLPTVSLATNETQPNAVDVSTTNSILPTVRLNLATEASSTPAQQVSESAMPTVSISANPQSIAPKQSEPQIAQTLFPNVNLQPAQQVSSPVEEEEMSEEEMQAELARQFAEQEAEKLREMEARAKAMGLDQTFQNIVNHAQTNDVVKFDTTPVVRVQSNMPAEPIKAEEPAKVEVAPQYPKGRETLIHPLLRQPAPLEKPTTPLPTLDLLTQKPAKGQVITEQDILDTSHAIEQTLRDFKVDVTVEDVLIGPVVTRYEIQPAAGTKGAKVLSVANDLARKLEFDAIRITEKVPNKPYMGIETPNRSRETVWLREVLASDEFANSTAKLPMALGKDISGQPIVVDMTKMPHLLVAGQTGSGKSVGVNTMILSLLYKLTPEQLRLILIDPKMLEFSIYSDIPHLITPVVTDMKDAANALNWAVEEMERRYTLLSALYVRNIEGYNQKIDLAASMNDPIPDPTWRPGDSIDKMPPYLKKMSYIVVIVDEFAELLMSNDGKKVEEHIQRITQKARAAGIHLILATQRPSTDVITGVIKANIPSRIAFRVATQIDSRTILERGGAETLLGNGDMLYKGASSTDLVRVHGAFMEDDDVQRVADNWRARGKPEYIQEVTASRESAEDVDGSSGDYDPIFDKVVEFVIDTNVTSITGIQRKFGLGFGRAARLVDQMESAGILSAPDSRSKRVVLAR